jgi:hypothetical protein
MSVRTSSQHEQPRARTGPPRHPLAVDESRDVVALLDRLDAELRATAQALDSYAARLRDVDGRPSPAQSPPDA